MRFTKPIADIPTHAIFPATLLFLEMPYDEVDVNVHPRKSKYGFGARNLFTISREMPSGRH